MATPYSDPNLVSFRPGAPERRDAGIEDQLAESIQANAFAQGVPVNMYEAEEALVVVAPLPGVMADDVTIEVDRRQLRIIAEARTLAPKRYLLHEWHYGPYERLVELPEGFEGDCLAHFGNGQLAVHVGRGGTRDTPVVVRPGSS